MPEIHYIKERNCLFINVYKQFMLTTFVFSNLQSSPT